MTHNRKPDVQSECIFRLLPYVIRPMPIYAPITIVIPDPPRLCSTPECSARGVAATHDNRCIYCHDSDRRDDFETMMAMIHSPGDYEARARMAAVDRAERPHVTAETRELRKPHPWSNSDD